jgi:hypothetical protein
MTVEVGPFITLPPAPISTRSDGAGSQAGRIAELENELVRLKGSQKEEEDHRHDPHLSELFPTRSVTLAIFNHEVKTSDRADGFSAFSKNSRSQSKGRRQKMTLPAAEERLESVHENRLVCRERQTQHQ